ncbi:vegetative incompatibility protein HET-E-1 [Echria macrotheca]|uniref:Vegetative incompatibility protein HET-E-1 n=1 Tax=Echria macrotheca TaxID=438768 RepID=A0AAJ0B122_9PEZI|nr:vegetative incompatibility protein HET-E-1 [Echria macrotheca]
MRLINTRTLRLREFTGRVPPYAILSHTWGKREVSLSEFRRLGSINDSKSLAKIRSACQQAFMDGLEYVWVDTCCIDKSSTAELSETINSMFEYYRRAQVCYALLEDVPSPDPDDAHNPAGCFWKSRWFTRGWTLQELIAPYHVHFFNQSWSKIGEKKGLTKLLESITGVDESVLSGGSLQHISVGRRMSWASNRRTTRPEDVAYSLLGIFDINMPMLYGEGMKAFIRLQEEILRQSDDQSLLAWRCTEPAFCSAPARGLLASSPRDFANFRSRLVDHGPKKGSLIQGDDIVPFQEFHEAENLVEMTNRGIRITSVVHDLQPQRPFESLALGLNCCTGDPGTSVVGIYLERHSGDRYVRARPCIRAGCESRQDTGKWV